MMIMPLGRAQTLAARRRFSARERWMLGGVLGIVAALVVAVAISIASAGHTSANGCVDVTIPYAFGGNEVYSCGAKGRAICAHVGAPGGYSGPIAATIAIECRKAGLAIAAGASTRPI